MKAITYKTIKNILRRACLVPAVLFLFLPGCSYVMDSIEGAINDRASFSIDVNTSGNNVTISWDETTFGGSFAGYEIYVTKEADDEYVGYELVASRWQDENGGSIAYPGDYGNLNLSTTHSFTYNPALDLGKVYFYRVGVIAWDESDEAEREKDYEGDVNWDQPAFLETNYNIHTEIDKISGAARVVIP